jgi:hypothetical protein
MIAENDTKYPATFFRQGGKLKSDKKIVAIKFRRKTNLSWNDLHLT